MTSEARSVAPGRGAARQLIDAGARWWPLLLGFALLAVPTFARLGEQVWSTDAGAHAPIVLATGGWLLFQVRDALLADRTPPRWVIVALGLLVALPLYAFGRAFDFISLEAAGLYLIGLTMAYRALGGRGMARSAFPFVYLGFLVPPPGWVIDRLTWPLQELISRVATGVLDWAGYPIARQGVSLYIAQYQLLVEDACSGMNSIMGLTAVSLFYIYILHRASWRYALVLLALIVPIAVAANLIRVIALVLITYYFGDAVAQGFLHGTAGFVLFALALALIFAVDSVLQRAMRAAGRRA